MGKGHHKESVPEVQDKAQMTKHRPRRIIPPPPDGGWGWMIVLSSFIIHVIADGIVYSFGVFFVEFLDYFGGGKGETAWVGSLVPAVTYSVGKRTVLLFVFLNNYNYYKIICWFVVGVFGVFFVFACLF